MTLCELLILVGFATLCTLAQQLADTATGLEHEIEADIAAQVLQDAADTSFKSHWLEAMQQSTCVHQSTHFFYDAFGRVHAWQAGVQPDPDGVWTQDGDFCAFRKTSLARPARESPAMQAEESYVQHHHPPRTDWAHCNEVAAPVRHGDRISLRSNLTSGALRFRRHKLTANADTRNAVAAYTWRIYLASVRGTPDHGAAALDSRIHFGRTVVLESADRASACITAGLTDLTLGPCGRKAAFLVGQLASGGVSAAGRGAMARSARSAALWTVADEFTLLHVQSRTFLGVAKDGATACLCTRASCAFTDAEADNVRWSIL